MMRSLEALDLSASRTQISFPSSRVSFTIELDKLGLTRELSNMNILLGTFPRVVVSVLELSSIMPPPNIVSTSNSLTSIIRHYLAWNLDVYVQLWRIVLQWSQIIESGAGTTTQLFLQFLACLGNFCDAYPLLSGEFSLDMKAMCIRLQCVADIVSSGAPCEDSNVQLACRHAIESTAGAAMESAAVTTYMEDILLPTLVQTEHDGSSLQTVKSSLKVCRLTALTHRCLLDTRSSS